METAGRTIAYGSEKPRQEVAIVTVPYEGLVRRIKWVSQNNNSLQAEVTLAVDL